ncbi:hypothetical protein EB796_001992 [Bugula neritina]|uniref:Uncharacterized protein n=1 Tax=Bugula neritina TaxID=10212 RepID=A0A7J7KNI1_BUGNE|nr:hypothetical protein EB796_001992 [Bugula neritina]
MPDMVSLPQLLDLSLGTPEAGAVNFNNLHKPLAAHASNKRVESNEDGIKTAMVLIEKLVKDMDQLKSENQELRQNWTRLTWMISTSS